MRHNFSVFNINYRDKYLLAWRLNFYETKIYLEIF